MKTSRKTAILTVAILSAIIVPQVSNAASSANAMRRGLGNMKDKQFLQAATNFVQSAELAAGQDRSPARAWFNAGNAFYRAGKYQLARDNYSKAVEVEDLELQSRAFYNLGNVDLKLSDVALDKGDAPLALNLLKQSAANYEKSIALAPEYMESKYNYELSGKKQYDLHAKVDTLRDDIEKARRLASVGKYQESLELLQSRAKEHAIAFQLEPDLKKRYEDLQKRVGQIIAVLKKVEEGSNAQK